MTWYNSPPRLLDLFCGAGGCSRGYAAAGFEVTGVDYRRQLSYPYAFKQANVLNLDIDFLRQFDAIHASPPCQAYSAMTALKGVRSRQEPLDLGPEHPQLIEPVRQMLQEAGRPYVIENVPGAPLLDPVLLCGAMFDLGVIRHRLFESNIPLRVPEHPGHDIVTSKPYFSCVVGMGGAWRGRNGSRDTEDWKKAMGIDQMDRYGLTQAIPPAYAKWIGQQLMEAVAP